MTDFASMINLTYKMQIKFSRIPKKGIVVGSNGSQELRNTMTMMTAVMLINKNKTE